MGISIHALLAESDIEVVEIGVGCLIFLSTLSLRRATNLRVVDGSRSSIISIHALLAESDVTVLGIQHRVGISIHALLAESDAALEDAESEPQNISIHALLAESDHNRQSRKQRHPHFYLRSPCGERLSYVTNVFMLV